MSINDFLEKQKQFLQDKKNNPEMEYQDLADMREIFFGNLEHRDTIRKGCKIINEYIDAGWDLVSPNKDTNGVDLESKASFELKNDGTGVSDRLIRICEGQEITPEFLMEAHNLSPKEWKVASYRNNYWHSQVRGGTKLIMYQSRLSVVPINNNEVNFSMIEEWFKKFEPKPISYKKISTNYGNGNNCLVLPVVDLHYNLLSTKFICGEDYNCEIAKDRFLSVIDDIIERVKDKSLKKIIFPLGNDLFNANGISGTTFKGTPQTNEKHIFEAYVELFEIMIFAITKLAEIAPVDIVYIPSNHDKEVTFYFIHNLNTQFKNDENINVDYSPISKKYIKYGNTVMMFAHNEKMNTASGTVFDEATDLLSGAKFIEVFLAHLHTETVKQDKNITIRRLPTFSGRSTWSVENSYGSNSLNQSFIINDTKNITDILYTMI